MMTATVRLGPSWVRNNGGAPNPAGQLAGVRLGPRWATGS